MPKVLMCSVLALCACGASSPAGPEIVYSPCSPLQVVADADATASERESIPAAIALWREVGLTTLTTSDVEGEQVPVRFAVSTTLFRGLYEPTLGVVSINRDLDSEGQAITLAHELGHALGLPHVPLKERSSVMNPGNLTVLPSLADKAELERLWSCPDP